jgi:hypothetical protein
VLDGASVVAMALVKKIGQRTVHQNGAVIRQGIPAQPALLARRRILYLMSRIEN